MRIPSVLFAFLLLCGVSVVNGQTGTEGEAVLVTSEYSTDIRSASIQLLIGNGLVNAGDASQHLLFDRTAEVVKGWSALKFKSTPFTFDNQTSSIEFDARFRFTVHSSSEDVSPMKEGCDGVMYAVNSRCEFLKVFINVKNSETGESVYTITSEDFDAVYGQDTEELRGDRYRLDVAALREKLSGVNVPLYIEMTVLTSPTLIAIHQSDLVSYEEGAGTLGLQ